jgi:hypothetical protein
MSPSQAVQVKIRTLASGYGFYLHFLIVPTPERLLQNCPATPVSHISLQSAEFSNWEAARTDG